VAEHVSFVRMRVKPGKMTDLLEQLAKWDRERKPHAKGFVHHFTAANHSDPNELWTCIRWDSTENYQANSNSPEQDAWFRELRTCLADDPTWFDGSIFYEFRGP